MTDVTNAERSKLYRVRHAERIWAARRAPETRRKAAEAQRRYRARHPERDKENQRRSEQKARDECFAAYGCCCACCGEDEKKFLCVDHIDGGGRQHRLSVRCMSSVRFYSWLRRHGYPASYRLLCYNCNCARAYHGQCPHQLLNVKTG